MGKLNLDAKQLEKYTTGYNCQTEVVTVLKGLVPQARTISILHIRDDWKGKEAWAPSEDMLQALKLRMPTDEERALHAARVEQRKEGARRKAERKEQKRSAAREQEREQEEEMTNAEGQT